MIKKAMTCCFIGHREINKDFETETKLKGLIFGLIEQGVTQFLFGDHSDFNDLCYEIVTKLKKANPNIRRIHFRTNYPEADEYTKGLLTMGYEESVFASEIALSGKAVYVERNRAMIKASDICVFYCNKSEFVNSKSSKRKSGTKLAYDYAVSHNKKIYNLYVGNCMIKKDSTE